MHSQHKGPTMPAQPERPPLGDKFDPARYARAYVNSGEPLSEDRVLDSILRALRAVRSLAWHIDAGGKKTRASLFRAGISLRAGGLGDAPEGVPRRRRRRARRPRPPRRGQEARGLDPRRPEDPGGRETVRGSEGLYRRGEAPRSPRRVRLECRGCPGDRGRYGSGVLVAEKSKPSSESIRLSLGILNPAEIAAAKKAQDEKAAKAAKKAALGAPLMFDGGE